MSDYIKREAVIDVLVEMSTLAIYEDSFEVIRGIRTAIEKIYAGDVVERKKGKWEWNINDGFYYCSECEAISPREDQYGEYCDCPNFCPNCGADMRGET